MNSNGGCWRYQVVIRKHFDENKQHTWDTFSLCEIYLDSEGRLEGSAENMNISPSGNDIEDLVGSIENMLSDARKWKPVCEEDLKVGMTFEKTEDSV